MFSLILFLFMFFILTFCNYNFAIQDDSDDIIYLPDYHFECTPNINYNYKNEYKYVVYYKTWVRNSYYNNTMICHNMNYKNIIRNTNIKNLNSKFYTWVILTNHTIVYGKYENFLEFGTKHVYLTENNEFIYAGELKIINNNYIINLESGLYRSLLKCNFPYLNQNKKKEEEKSDLFEFVQKNKILNYMKIMFDNITNINSIIDETGKTLFPSKDVEKKCEVRKIINKICLEPNLNCDFFSDDDDQEYNKITFSKIYYKGTFTIKNKKYCMGDNACNYNKRTDQFVDCVSMSNNLEFPIFLIIFKIYIYNIC